MSWLGPRKPKRFATASARLAEGDDISDFISDNLIELKTNLTKRLKYKLNQRIDWVPPKQSQNVEPKPKGLGSNNTHYVVPKINGVFGGRSKVEGNPSWQDVEKYAKEFFDLYQTDQTATRNIDYWRKVEWDGKEYEQGCEVKKTTGCYNKQPVFIRSSKEQLERLATVQAICPDQLGPSIYIIGSCDWDRDEKWVITWWFIPVKDTGDFLCFDTSNFRNERRSTGTNDGWIKPV